MELEDRFDGPSFDAVTASLLFSELTPEEQAYVLRTVRGLLQPGGLVVIADEVKIAGARGWWRRVARIPVAAVTYLLTQTGTRPVEGLPERLEAAGFIGVEVERDAPGGTSIFTARRGQEAA
jgi:demethylmenaquinone methyltransferase/2-methoxy-6-polyprenyl-1,4-benzoquinol methylase